MDVVRMDDWRPEGPTPSNDSDAVRCPCGCEWFHLEAAVDVQGAVRIGPDGQVVDHAGTPFCIECGRRWR